MLYLHVFDVVRVIEYVLIFMDPHLIFLPKHANIRRKKCSTLKLADSESDSKLII